MQMCSQAKKSELKSKESLIDSILWARSRDLGSLLETFYESNTWPTVELIHLFRQSYNCAKRYIKIIFLFTQGIFCKQETSSYEPE